MKLGLICHELSVVIPASDEAENLRLMLPKLWATLKAAGIDAEVVVVEGGSTDGTYEVAEAHGARAVRQQVRGYGSALREGFAQASGRYVLTLDADLSHDPDFIHEMWRRRSEAHLIIASRYVPGGVAEMPRLRKVLSRILNAFFSRGLSIPLKDLSSGFRIYERRVLNGIALEGQHFDILPEIVVKAYAEGWRVIEVPFHYKPRKRGRSHAKLFRLGVAFLKTFFHLWTVRKSIASADYDARAFHSPIPLQRAWQSRRYGLLRHYVNSVRAPIVNVGCGSAQFVLTRDCVGLDLQLRKLRYVKRFNPRVVIGDVFSLPFCSGCVPCVVCSEVIEHLPASDEFFREIRRVLMSEGVLIICTPDYGRWRWRVIERLYRWIIPGNYADEHVTPYSRRSLFAVLSTNGFRVVEHSYVFGAELIVKAVKLAI